MREAFVVEGLEDDLDLLLEQCSVGLLIAQRRTKRFHLARVVAATDAKNDAAAGENVGHGEILRQPQRVPHRSDIEAATDLDVPRLVGEVQRHEDSVGNALRAFGLEVMLGEPETVVAQAIHEPGHGLGLAQRRCEVRVGITPLVDGRPSIADIVEVGVTGKKAVKLGDHSVPLPARAELKDIELARIGQRVRWTSCNSSAGAKACGSQSTVNQRPVGYVPVHSRFTSNRRPIIAVLVRPEAIRSHPYSFRD